VPYTASLLTASPDTLSVWARGARVTMPVRSLARLVGWPSWLTRVSQVSRRATLRCSGGPRAAHRPLGLPPGPVTAR
jgi:hypothetical protein